jgi:hypothetical protein
MSENNTAKVNEAEKDKTTSSSNVNINFEFKMKIDGKPAFEYSGKIEVTENNVREMSRQALSGALSGLADYVEKKG